MPNIKGTWQWDDNPQVNVPSTIDQNVNFTSNGENFERIEIRGFIRYYYAGEHDPEYIDVTATATWTKSDYKYLDFGATDQTVDDDFYSFIEENAAPYMSVQIGAVYPVTLLTRDKYVDKNIRVLPPPADEPVLEEKTVTPNDEIQVIEPSQGYDALSKVTVNAVPTEEKTATPTEQQQLIEPSEGQYLSSVTVEAIEATEKSVTENGEYTPDTGTYYKKVNVNVPQYTDISSTTAQASDVLEGKYFFPYNGAPRTEGTIPVRTASNPEFTSKNDSVTFQEGYYSEASTVKIAESEKEKIIPENIKDGEVILGVTGSYAGGGMDINGAINEYVVNAGTSVSAGDFVEFVSADIVFSDTPANYVAACLIDDNKVLVAYQDGSSPSYGYAAVVTISDTGITVGTKYQFTNQKPNYISLCKIDTNKACVVFETTASFIRYLRARVLTISGNTITFGESVDLDTVNAPSYICACSVDTNRILTAYKRGTDGVYVYAGDIDGTVINTTPSTRTRMMLDTCLYLSICAVDTNKAVVAYNNSTDVGGRAKVITVASNRTFGFGSEFVFSSNNISSCNIVPADTDNAIVTFTVGSFAYQQQIIKRLTVNNKTITGGGNYITAGAVFNESSQSGKLCRLMADKFLMVSGNDPLGESNAIATAFSLVGTGFGGCNTYVFSRGFSSYFAPVAISENAAIVFYRTDNTSKCVILNVGDNFGTNENNISRNNQINPTYVQPATTRDNYAGVAKTGGTAGQTVEVYEVPLSYAVTVSNTNCVKTSVTSPMKQTDTQIITFTANTGYTLPKNITVTNCEYEWSAATGQLTITNLTGNVQITVNATVQKLAAPVIALNGSVISWSAVANATSYGIFADNQPFGASTTGTSFDLANYEKAIGAGTKNITVNAQGSPYAPSDASNAVSYTVIALSAPTLTWTAASGLLTWTASENAESYTVYEQISSSDWNEVTTTTATYASIDFDAGAHTMAVKATSTTKVDSALSNAVTVNVYGISTTLTGVTGASGNVSKIYEGTSETLTFTADDGYTLPETITVTNAQYTWNNGTLTLSNPTGNVTVTITGVQEQIGYTVTVYNMYKENRTTHVTINGHTIQPGQNYTFTNVTELTFGTENDGLDVSVKMNSTTASWGGDYQWTSFPQSITIAQDCNVATWVEVF